MSDPYLGEVRAIAFNYAPEGWALCDGSLLPVNQYQALYAILGNSFGGTYPTNFGLPDLRGRVIAGVGAGPGINAVTYAQKAGANSVQLAIANLPAHTHPTVVNDPGHAHSVTVPNHTHPFSIPCAPPNTTATEDDPNGNLLANTSAISAAVSGADAPLYAPNTGTIGSMNSGNTGNPSATPAGASSSATTGISVTNAMTGSDAPVSTEPPFLGLYYIIATEGVYPMKP